MLYGSNVKLFIDYILTMSNAMYAKEIIISNYRNYWIFRIIVHCIKQNISRLINSFSPLGVATADLA